MPSSSCGVIRASVASLVTSVSPLFSMSSHGENAMTPPGSGLPWLASAKGDGDGEVAAGGVADGGDVRRRDAGCDERIERGHTVLDLGGMGVLGGASVVQHEADDAESLGDVAGELAVAGGRADGEPAAVRVEQHLGVVRSLRQAPDSRDSADGLLAVGHALGLDGGLVPLVEHAAEQADAQVRRGRHDLGPIRVELAEHVLVLNIGAGDAGLFGGGGGHFYLRLGSGPGKCPRPGCVSYPLRRARSEGRHGVWIKGKTVFRGRCVPM